MFYVTGPATSFQRFDPMSRAPRPQTAHTEGIMGWLPGPAGPRNQDRVHKGQLEGTGITEHTVTLSPRLMPDVLVGNTLYYNKDTGVNMSKYDKYSIKIR